MLSTATRPIWGTVWKNRRGRTFPTSIAVPPYPCVEQENGSYRKWSVWLCEHCVKFLADSKRSHFFGWKNDGRTAVPMGWTAKCPLWKLISVIARALCEVFNPIEEVAHFSQFWPYRRTRTLNRGYSGIKLSVFMSMETYFCAEEIKKVASFGQTPGTLEKCCCKSNGFSNGFLL